MPTPPSLPVALLRHAAADPEEPWLFRAEGWDWRWHPWGELAGWMEGWAERLAEDPFDRPAGSRAAFLYKADPESVILDLAIQAAGLVSAPASERRDEPVWIEPLPSGLTSRHPLEREAGGVVTSTGEWTAAELVAAGERLREVIQAQGKREIVVLGGPLQDPVERTMLAWAILAGAAVVLEPNPALRPATAAWVRPTVFHGSPGDIAVLRTHVAKVRKWRLPFRRLRTVLATGEMAAEDQAFWGGRGVRVAAPFAAKRHHRGI
jgi:hypothetical protein